MSGRKVVSVRAKDQRQRAALGHPVGSRQCSGKTAASRPAPPDGQSGRTVGRDRFGHRGPGRFHARGGLTGA